MKIHNENITFCVCYKPPLCIPFFFFVVTQYPHEANIMQVQKGNFDVRLQHQFDL